MKLKPTQTLTKSTNRFRQSPNESHAGRGSHAVSNLHSVFSTYLPWKLLTICCSVDENVDVGRVDPKEFGLKVNSGFIVVLV